MTNFNDRERAEEAKFAMDEDTAFRVAARRNKERMAEHTYGPQVDPAHKDVGRTVN